MLTIQSSVHQSFIWYHSISDSKTYIVSFSSFQLNHAFLHVFLVITSISYSPQFSSGQNFNDNWSFFYKCRVGSNLLYHNPKHMLISFNMSNKINLTPTNFIIWRLRFSVFLKHMKFTVSLLVMIKHLCQLISSHNQNWTS